MNEVDDVSADYIMSRAQSTHTTPAQIISSFVREKIAIGV
jgi:hypothetical protein